MGSYKEDVKIDIYSLHTEVAGQGQIYMEYAEQYADAVALMMRAQEKMTTAKAEGKKKVDEARAEIDADVRVDPDKYGLPKVTETAVANAVVVSERFKAVQAEVAKEIHDATEEYIEATRKKELLDGVKTGFSHRKAMIEKECELFLRGYYADPKIPKAYREAQEEDVKKALEEELGDMKERRVRRRRPDAGGEG